MNFEARRRLVEAVVKLYEVGDLLPAVPLELYLDGNSDNESLGKGMRRHYDLAGYATELRRLAARDDVTHVFVEVHETPDLDKPEDNNFWAQAFVIHVVTSMPIAALRKEIASLKPRSIDEGWCTEPGIRPPVVEIAPPFRPLRIDLG